MSKCERCGKTVHFPSGCCYCFKPFCSEHVFPESHKCTKRYWFRRTSEQPEISKSKNSVSTLLAFFIVLILWGANIAYIGYITGSRGLRDPTYLEALEFIESDQTDRNQYSEGKYTCVDFAIDFENNAFESGYKCGFVLVLFARTSHALNCFNTTDNGLIFVEPQEDKIVKVTVGQSYWNRMTSTPTGYNDTIIGFFIIWEAKEAQKFLRR